jgi:hypothetical protein
MPASDMSQYTPYISDVLIEIFAERQTANGPGHRRFRQNSDASRPSLVKLITPQPIWLLLNHL